MLRCIQRNKQRLTQIQNDTDKQTQMKLIDMNIYWLHKTKIPHTNINDPETIDSHIYWSLLYWHICLPPSQVANVTLFWFCVNIFNWCRAAAKQKLPVDRIPSHDDSFWFWVASQPTRSLTIIHFKGGVTSWQNTFSSWWLQISNCNLLWMHSISGTLRLNSIGFKKIIHFDMLVIDWWYQSKITPIPLVLHKYNERLHCGRYWYIPSTVKSNLHLIKIEKAKQVFMQHSSHSYITEYLCRPSTLWVPKKLKVMPKQGLTLCQQTFSETSRH